MSYGIAEYKCQRCDYKWAHPPKPTECPECGHLYCDWINFKLWQISYENWKNQNEKNS